MMKMMMMSGRLEHHLVSLLIPEIMSIPRVSASHRQFDIKQLLTQQDEDTIGEHLKRKYAEEKVCRREGI